MKLKYFLLATLTEKTAAKKNECDLGSYKRELKYALKNQPRDPKDEIIHKSQIDVGEGLEGVC